ERDAEVRLEDGRDAVAILLRQRFFERGKEGGFAELAILCEQVLNARIADGGDHRPAFELDADLPRAEEARGARLHHVLGVPVRGFAERREERAAREAAGLLDRLERAARHEAITRGLHPAGVEREDAQALLEELG